MVALLTNIKPFLLQKSFIRPCVIAVYEGEIVALVRREYNKYY